MTGRTGKPPRERVDLRIAPDGLEIVRTLAEREQRTLSDMLRVLVLEALAARGELPQREPRERRPPIVIDPRSKP